MTREEALEHVMNAVDNLEDLAEEFDILGTVPTSDGTTDGDNLTNEWKEKYDALKEQYIKRFTDAPSMDAPTDDADGETDDDDVSIDDLDFDGSTE